jgi:hypothetical protein
MASNIQPIARLSLGIQHAGAARRCRRYAGVLE